MAVIHRVTFTLRETILSRFVIPHPRIVNNAPLIDNPMFCNIQKSFLIDICEGADCAGVPVRKRIHSVELKFSFFTLPVLVSIEYSPVRLNRLFPSKQTPVGLLKRLRF